MAEQDLFTFTEDQLTKLLCNVIDLYDENKKKHGQQKDVAVPSTVIETIDALDSELQMFMASEGELTMQSDHHLNLALAALCDETIKLAYKNDLRDANDKIERLQQMIRVRDALLVACEHALGDMKWMFENPFGGSPNEEIMAELEKAIAKARGTA